MILFPSELRLTGRKGDIKTMKRNNLLLNGFAALLMAGATAFAANAGADHNRLAEQVRKEIATLPNYGVFDDIHFRLDGSTLVLEGVASRPSLKNSAERAAARIEGVGAVENKIDVLGNSRFDDDIRLRTYVAVYGDPVLNRYRPGRGTPIYFSRIRALNGITNDPPVGAHPIHIIVDGGHVRLEGLVASEIDRNIAGIRANQISNVFSVENNLAVAGRNPASRTD